jgi:hypothetical protein
MLRINKKNYLTSSKELLSDALGTEKQQSESTF